MLGICLRQGLWVWAGRALEVPGLTASAWALQSVQLFPVCAMSQRHFLLQISQTFTLSLQANVFHICSVMIFFDVVLWKL